MNTKVVSPMSNYEREYGKPVPDGYVEIAEPNGLWTLQRADGLTLSDHEARILFAPPPVRPPPSDGAVA